MNSHYRWVIVAAGALMGCFAIGSIFSPPVFLQPMSVATYSEGAIAKGAPHATAYRGKRGVGTGIESQASVHKPKISGGVRSVQNIPSECTSCPLVATCYPT